jgi:iron complex transport system substrate-binding protein
MARVEGWLTNLREPVTNPRRIVSIAPSNTEILHALGLGQRIVAVDKWSDYPPRVLNLPNIGSDLKVDVDRVAAMEPDLVVACLHVPGMEANIPEFEHRGLPYIAVGGVRLEGVWEDMRVLGEWVGRSARAEATIDRAKRRLEAVGKRYANVRNRPRVHWEWSARPVVAGQKAWVTEIIELAGGQNAYTELEHESARLTLDDVAAAQPEVIVACWCGARKLPTERRVAKRPGWESIVAGADGRVKVFAEDLFGRPGPRLPDGAEALGRFLHPDR